MLTKSFWSVVLHCSSNVLPGGNTKITGQLLLFVEPRSLLLFQRGSKGTTPSLHIFEFLHCHIGIAKSVHCVSLVFFPINVTPSKFNVPIVQGNILIQTTTSLLIPSSRMSQSIELTSNIHNLLKFYLQVSWMIDWSARQHKKANLCQRGEGNWLRRLRVAKEI